MSNVHRGLPKTFLSFQPGCLRVYVPSRFTSSQGCDPVCCETWPSRVEGVRSDRCGPVYLHLPWPNDGTFPGDRASPGHHDWLLPGQCHWPTVWSSSALQRHTPGDIPRNSTLCHRSRTWTVCWLPWQPGLHIVCRSVQGWDLCTAEDGVGKEATKAGVLPANWGR